MCIKKGKFVFTKGTFCFQYNNKLFFTNKLHVVHPVDNETTNRRQFLLHKHKLFTAVFRRI